MRMFVGMGIAGSLMMAAAPAWAQPDEISRIECELTGECGEAADDANAVSDTPARAAGEPRSSSTRGFTFRRSSTGASEAAAPAAPRVATSTPAAAPARAAESRSVDLRVSFPPNSTVLSEDARRRLGNVAAVLTSPRLVSRRLRIEGHTDASGSATVNLDLSRRRAQAVADYLISVGVDRGRLETVGHGSSRPLPGVPSNAAANRRVMAVLL